MSRYLRLLGAALLLFQNLSVWSDLIEQKPYTEWTKEEVIQILSMSPWVSLSSAGARRVEYQIRIGDPTSGFDAFSVPIYYRVRLLTAKPVREAWLRWVELIGIPEPTVSANKLRTQNTPAEKKAALERYLALHPDDGALRGDNQNIIIGITIRVGRYESLKWTEESNASELSNVFVPQLKAETVLSTDTGKQVQLLRYVPPGQDWFGARYYFPRYLASGAPLVGTHDTKLLFETHINGRHVKAKFDLRKMRYKGELGS